MSNQFDEYSRSIGRAEGAKAERERIIKLLADSDLCPTEDTGKTFGDCENYRDCDECWSTTLTLLNDTPGEDADGRG